MHERDDGERLVDGRYPRATVRAVCLEYRAHCRAGDFEGAKEAAAQIYVQHHPDALYNAMTHVQLIVDYAHRQDGDWVDGGIGDAAKAKIAAAAKYRPGDRVRLRLRPEVTWKVAALRITPGGQIDYELEFLRHTPHGKAREDELELIMRGPGT